MVREILNEPVFPYIKSKEEIEFEKRMMKRKNAIGSFRRMQLEYFKESLMQNIQSQKVEPV